jgi:hypothetical protein
MDVTTRTNNPVAHAGRQHTMDVTGGGDLSDAVSDAPVWDGEEFVPEVIEEEFDLSDLDDVDLDEDATPKDEL